MKSHLFILVKNYNSRKIFNSYFKYIKTEIEDEIKKRFSFKEKIKRSLETRKFRINYLYIPMALKFPITRDKSLGLATLHTTAIVSFPN